MIFCGTVDERNPAPVDNVVYPIIYKVLYIPSGAGFQPSTVLLHKSFNQLNGFSGGPVN